MDWQNTIGNLINEVTGGNQPGAVGSAMSKMETPQVAEAVANSAQQMQPEQRAGLVGTLLGGLSQAGGNLSGLLGRLGVNPAVADDPGSATPEEVATLAAHAHEHEPGIFQHAMSFYEQHPTLVQAMGMVAAAAIAQHVQRGGQR